ncbi:hypothetical protein [Endozoicomonas sp. SCSIO W0465]|uniref:hypothetical protein n=1 Tax=Endozoicomonas sp. SCSIO W0465 TaxID=2918516 RepID=UPI0020761F6B|nr:hypothetical protein [Endozoicomonas sp. SCSIO W0465]USE33831.1 hypothetical protein MJO57_16795 [Endozoicomonas sp. SCSIO W0465]
MIKWLPGFMLRQNRAIYNCSFFIVLLFSFIPTNTYSNVYEYAGNAPESSLYLGDEVDDLTQVNLEDDTEANGGNNKPKKPKADIDYYKDLVRSEDKDVANLFKEIIDNSNYVFNDLMMESLIIPFAKFAGEYQDVFNHHIIDPVRRGKHYMRYMDSVMLGTFDNMLNEDTGTTNWPYAIAGVPYGWIVKNVVSDFKLGSEVRSPGIIDSKYHNHPVLVERLGAETGKVGTQMSETHSNELVVIDVVKPFMPRLEIWDEENSLSSSLYHFYYATKELVTDVHQIIEFEDTDFFKQTGRYEESDRTFLHHWNKTISKRSAFRSGQIIRVDRKGYFSMGPVPIAWNYCEVMLHEGGTKDIEVIEEEDETEIYYEHPETYEWGVRGDKMVPRERIRTVRKKVVKQVPNVTTFRVYTENLCLAAEASVRSKSEVITYTTRRLFSWLVPGLAFMGAPSVSYLLIGQLGITDYFPLTTSLMAAVFLTSLVIPSMWKSDIEDTMHSIKFPPPDNF